MRGEADAVGEGTLVTDGEVVGLAEGLTRGEGEVAGIGEIETAGSGAGTSSAEANAPKYMPVVFKPPVFAGKLAESSTL